VVLCAHAKGVSVDVINVNLNSKEMPDWFVEKINPHGKVPVIEHEGNIIRESLIAFGLSVII
jgi:glutathione S-transferase